MRIRIFPHADAAARALAREVVSALARRPGLVLGLPAGRTPIPLYRALRALYDRGVADFSRATTFNLDEFVGLPPDDPRSYRAFMQARFFEHVNLVPRRLHFLDGAAEPAAECARYERAITRAGGIDLQLLGLGVNAHIGFNEPAEALVARTHRARLSAASRRANAAGFGNRPGRVPREALTMGMATILHARRIVVLATGGAKARAVARMVEGPLTSWAPASLLQLHREAEVWLDEAAAGKLQARRRGAASLRD